MDTIPVKEVHSVAEAANNYGLGVVLAVILVLALIAGFIFLIRWILNFSFQKITDMAKTIEKVNTVMDEHIRNQREAWGYVRAEHKELISGFSSFCSAFKVQCSEVNSSHDSSIKLLEELVTNAQEHGKALAALTNKGQ